jgi:glycosyltransferase involved in cell wall biosynthesis
MRVLRVADVPGATPGGMRDFMLESGRVLEDQGHEIDYLFREDLAPRLTRGGARRLVVPWLVARRVLRSQRAGARYDVVEIHEPLAAPYCVARRGLRRLELPPCVVASYGVEGRRWEAQAQRWRALGLRGSLKSRVTVPLTLLAQSRYALRHADQILVPSEDDLSYLRNKLDIPQLRLTRVDSGVSDVYFGIERPAYDVGDLRVLFIASWIDRKGNRELAEAWSLLAARQPSLRLTLSCTVAEESEVLPWFRTAAERVRVQARADQEDLVTTLATHDVFVLPAWFEGGMPLATLQAAAAGLACVVSAIGGHVEIFRPRSSEMDGALLVAPHDAPALAAAIERLASNRELVRTLGERARRRASSFTWRETSRNLLLAYEAACNGAGPEGIAGRKG